MAYGVIGNTADFGSVVQGSSPCRPTSFSWALFVALEELKRGDSSPLFCYYIMSETFKKEVSALLDAFFEERPDLFLIELTIGADLSVRVVVDGDSGVNVNDCVEVSRAIEHHLDREKYDFSLDVLSAGATAPLKHLRQFKQHLGRTLKIDTAEGSFKGEFTAISDQLITLRWKERQPKPVGKGKTTVECEQQIEFDQIINAQIELIF